MDLFNTFIRNHVAESTVVVFAQRATPDSLTAKDVQVL
jgi:hypothetical protein